MRHDPTDRVAFWACAAAVFLVCVYFVRTNPDLVIEFRDTIMIILR
jgi:hypothetical protein